MSSSLPLAPSWKRMEPSFAIVVLYVGFVIAVHPLENEFNIEACTYKFTSTKNYKAVVTLEFTNHT